MSLKRTSADGRNLREALPIRRLCASLFWSLVTGLIFACLAWGFFLQPVSCAPFSFERGPLAQSSLQKGARQTKIFKSLPQQHEDTSPHRAESDGTGHITSQKALPPQPLRHLERLSQAAQRTNALSGRDNQRLDECLKPGISSSAAHFGALLPASSPQLHPFLPDCPSPGPLPPPCGPPTLFS